MSESSQPSPVYVFVVLSLAAFLTLFTLFRQPGVIYETEAYFRGSFSAEEVENYPKVKQKWEANLIAPEFVLDALRAADMLEGPTNPQTLAIAASIAERMDVTSYVKDGRVAGRLSLVTERPESAITLLDEMTSQFESLATRAGRKAEVFPATIAWQRGGSINARTWILLVTGSCVAGLVGLVLCNRAKNSSVLTNNMQTEEVLPVVGDFCDEEQDEFVKAIGVIESQQVARRRTFNGVLRAAEAAVAAVFFLMVSQLLARDAFVDRFLGDPLAAYGEALTRLIG